MNENEENEATEPEIKERKPKRSDVYKCPRCGSKVTVHVKLFDAPVCQNAKSHATTAIAMELVK